MADKLIVDWKEYNTIVEKLAIKVYDSGFKPDLLIGIMRGGAPIIDVLSRVFKLKCDKLSSKSMDELVSSSKSSSNIISSASISVGVVCAEVFLEDVSLGDFLNTSIIDSKLNVCSQFGQIKGSLFKS